MGYTDSKATFKAMTFYKSLAEKKFNLLCSEVSHMIFRNSEFLFEILN